ncbi:MAG: hypothetical protein H6712_21500 [Myxococcales bacterium]|nr:hypothetical protein [Myxococcales bacterium]MCB9716453.1 hypothetical protein [Myxococcales bacterium]
MHDPDSSSIPWPIRAALAGVLACGFAATIGSSLYFALPGAERLDWTVMPVVLVLFVLVCGLSIGLCVGATTRFAARRGLGLPGLMVAGATGGVLAGIAPGILGIAGFGSLSAPYMGTANILGSVLIGVIAFVALWSPSLFPRREGSSPALHLAHAAAASIISLGAFGMVAWSLATAFDLVPNLDTFIVLAHQMGLMRLAVVGGVLVGAAGGAAVGAACGLVRRLGR